MKVLIVEDESLAARTLAGMVHNLPGNPTVIGTVEGIAQAVEWLNANGQPDLVFMDIQLSDGVSFEIFERYDLTAPVIFTTAYDQYAIQAFKVNSIDYLLKPISQDELEAAWSKFLRLKENNVADQQDPALRSVMQQLLKQDGKQLYKERFLVPYRGGYVPVSAKDVAYFVKDELIYLYTTTGQRYVTDFTSIEQIEHVLHPEQFFRANRQVILARSVIESLRTTINGKVQVKLKGFPELAIDVSREKARAFKEWLS